MCVCAGAHTRWWLAFYDWVAVISGEADLLYFIPWSIMNSKFFGVTKGIWKDQELNNSVAKAH